MCGRENEKVSNMQYNFDQFAELQIVSNINQKVWKKARNKNLWVNLLKREHHWNFTLN